MRRVAAVAVVVLALVGAQVPAEAGRGRVLNVGPTRALREPSDAALVAQSGDIVEIDAGAYPGDVAVWTQDDLTLRGVGGGAHLRADGANAQGKAIWVIQGDRTTVEGIEFSGATVPDGNGAGIRQEGAGLTVRNSYFHDNENGILAGENRASDIAIISSEFAGNGAGDGYTHNIYIGTVRSFTLRASYVHGADRGHEVKSRALRNRIVANWITDADTTASYSIDIPDGGDTRIVGNVIEQGPNSENSAIISFAAESSANPRSRLWLVNNTVVNQRGSGLFVQALNGGDLHLWNNLLVGPGDVVDAPAERRANRRLADGSSFVDATAGDYRLAFGSPAIDRARRPPLAALWPMREYRHPLRAVRRPVEGRLDLGAYEFRG